MVSPLSPDYMTAGVQLSLCTNALPYKGKKRKSNYESLSEHVKLPVISLQRVLLVNYTVNFRLKCIFLSLVCDRLIGCLGLQLLIEADCCLYLGENVPLVCYLVAIKGG